MPEAITNQPTKYPGDMKTFSIATPMNNVVNPKAEAFSGYSGKSTKLTASKIPTAAAISDLVSL